MNPDDGQQSAALQTKTRILETAKQLFLQRGYHNVSMRLLAKEAGVSTGPLYFHYQNKTQVFYEICCGGLDRLNTAVTLAADTGATYMDKLQQIFMVFQRFYRQDVLNSHMIRTSGNPLSGIDFTEEQRARLFEKKRLHMDTMESVIREGIANGQLQPMDPRRFMLVLYALGEGLVTLHESEDLDRFGVTLEQLMADASRLTYTGIVVRPEGDIKP